MQVSVLTIDTAGVGCYAVTMPRELRIEYPGAIYHTLNRGDQREDVFLDDGDRQRFLGTPEERCAKTGWEAHAYCLMRNHFQLVIETPEPTWLGPARLVCGFGAVPARASGGVVAARGPEQLRCAAARERPPKDRAHRPGRNWAPGVGRAGPALPPQRGRAKGQDCQTPEAGDNHEPEVDCAAAPSGHGHTYRTCCTARQQLRLRPNNNHRCVNSED